MNRSTTRAIAVLLAAGYGVAGSVGSPANAAAPDSITIGVIEIAQVDILDQIMREFEATVSAGLAPTEVTFDVQNANGDQSLIASITRDMAGSDYDAFAVIGTPAVIALAQLETERPIFAVAIGDPVGAGVAESLDEPGRNVTGSVDYVDPATVIDNVLAVHPDISSVGTVYDPSNQNMQVWVSGLSAALDERDIELVEATVSGTPDVAVASRSLQGRSDAILIGPDGAVIAGLDAIGASALADETPLYIIGGSPDDSPGVLGAIGPDYLELGAAAGDLAIDVLTGADPATTPFATSVGPLQVQYSRETLDALGVELPADVADDADIVG